MTFTIPDEVARRLQAAAAARGVPVEDAVVEALTEWTEQHTDELPALSFVGIGEGRADLAEHHDEILVEHLRDAS
jgi:class 3 adenylate cyclase